MTMNESQPNFSENRRHPRRRAPLTAELFWKRSIKPVGCWLYDGAREINGYGYLQNPFGPEPKFMTAHRAAWIYANGPIPEGMLVLHRCDVRACINPEHLFLGTDADNTVDKMRKLRSGNYGTTNIHAKLTDDLVRSIHAEWRPRMTNKMAAQHGVTTNTIREIVLGHTWRHLNLGRSPHFTGIAPERRRSKAKHDPRPTPSR